MIETEEQFTFESDPEKVRVLLICTTKLIKVLSQIKPGDSNTNTETESEKRRRSSIGLASLKVILNYS